MNKICYKVTNGGKSAIVQNNVVLKYKINHKTIPTIGKIFVFDTLQHARDFIAKNEDIIPDPIIYYGIANNVCDILYVSILPTFNSSYDDYEIIMDFWNKKKSKKRLTNRRCAPKGTLTCDAFTPFKIVR